MKNLELKAFRISLTIILILGISYLFSTVFFHVTNIDGTPYIPSGQSQNTFENNEFDEINFSLSGDSNWFLSTSSANTGLYSIQSGDINNDQNIDIFDIIDANYVPKPAPLVYAEFVKKFNVNPRNSIMFEDIARNLEPAAKLGMKTVWIQTDAPWSKAGINSIRPDYTTTCLSEWLGKIAGLENAPQ